jgi:glycosyltransferase involved in cell wall biosynthesis
LKRALIITYYWPPAGGPGVQRWLQFVKNFKDFGIEPIVYIPENPHYPLIDRSFVTEVADDIEIIKHPIKEPYGLARVFSKEKTEQISSGIISDKKQSVIEKLLLLIRGNFFIPDARVGWVKPSVVYLKKYITENPVDVVITSGPPHSLHLIGMRLKAEMQLKWIADFRDPWTTIHYHKSLRLTSVSEKKHKKLEKQVLLEADVVVVTSLTTKKEFETITDSPIKVITNGYVAREEIVRIPDTEFSISHIGSLLSQRNPKDLWKVLSEIASENATFKNDLKLKFAGVVSNDIVSSISEFGLIDNCEFLGYVSHSEALQLQYNSQVLLLIEINSPETRSIIPGKLFEYLAAHRPILALGPIGSDIQEILDETNGGQFYNYLENTLLKNYILELYADFRRGSLSVSSKGIEKYSRRELTREMAKVIEEL